MTTSSPTPGPDDPFDHPEAPLASAPRGAGRGTLPAEPLRGPAPAASSAVADTRPHEQPEKWPETPPRRTGRLSPRRIAIGAVAAVLLAVGIAYATAWYVHSLHYESTDDAFIDGHIISVAPRISGYVTQVYVEDNQDVKKGDLLVRLDTRDLEAKLAEAQAALQLAQAQQQAAQTNVDLVARTSTAARNEASSGVDAALAMVALAQAHLATAGSQVQEAEAQVSAEQATLERDEADLARLAPLAAARVATPQELDHARATVAVDKARVRAAEKAVAAAQTDATLAQAGVEETQVKVVAAREQLAAVNVVTPRVEVAKAQLAQAAADVAQRRGGEDRGTRAVLCDDHRRRAGTRHTQGRRARRLRRGGAAALRPRLPGRLGRGQFQGNPVGPHEAGRPRRVPGGRLSRPGLPRPGGFDPGRNRRTLQPPPAGECQRELYQGRATRARENRPGPHRREPQVARPGHERGPRGQGGLNPAPRTAPPDGIKQHVTGCSSMSQSLAENRLPSALAPARPAAHPWLICVAVMLGTFMEVLDTSVANVALPHIAGNLSATTDEATWVLTSYLVSNAIILPITGWASRAFGRKRLLMTCIVVFTIASFLCGAAGTLNQLILARIVQGMGGGALQPIAQAILLESFPGKKRGAAMAAYTLGIVFAPIIGPTVGGWITDNYTWRWVFYINIPVGILAVSMVYATVSDPSHIKHARVGKVDYIGFGLLAIWVGTFQILLDKGQQDDWFGTVWIRWAALIVALGFLAFVLRELLAKDPIVNLHVLKDRNFAAGTLLVTIVGVVLYGSTALLPLLLQDVMGYPALQSGLASAPAASARSPPFSSSDASSTSSTPAPSSPAPCCCWPIPCGCSDTPIWR